MRTRTLVPPALGNNTRDSKAYALFLVGGLLIATYPATVVGLGVAFAVWRLTKPDMLTRLTVAGVAALCAVSMQPVWPAWSFASLTTTLPAEMLLGPLVLVCFQLGADYRRQTIHGEEWQRHNAVEGRKRALERGWAGPDQGSVSNIQNQQPAGLIRLGFSVDDGRPFDLDREDLAQHVFIPGASGSGKTTTIMRLADGALAAGYGVVIVDCKGVGLGGAARTLAARHGASFTCVDPQDPESAGYDPCSGDAPTIANKLIGAFSFSGEAEIYKQVAMEVIPVICRAMAAAGIAITLDSIYDALGRGGLARLGRTKGAEAYRDRLEEMERADGVAAAGYVGLQKRLGALIEGSFGELFRKRPALDWHHEMQQPRVTYLSLSSTAASEDVELFGRVVTQDLKQVCDQRMRAIERGDDPVPVLVIYDEFAALREARQVTDLLLQARQARVPLVVATQYFPEDVAIRKPVLSAGVLIVHRIESEDANAVAAEFGTHTTTALTAQVDYATGESEKGSARWVEEFDIHPNILKELPIGTAAVFARRSGRKSLVRIARMT
jgi:hypothetical protein